MSFSFKEAAGRTGGGICPGNGKSGGNMSSSVAKPIIKQIKDRDST